MKSIKNKKFAVVLASILMFIYVSPVSAVSNIDDSELTPENAVDALEAVAITKVDCETVKEDSEGYIVETEDQTVVVNEENEIKIVADNEQLEVGVNFLFDGEDITTTEVDDIIVMGDKDNDYLVTTEIFDGGLRNSFIIEEDCNEESFPIQLDLPTGTYVEFSQDEYAGNEMDGSLLVINENHEIIGAIDIPWAKDANGNSVETYYTVDGNTIIQHVNHKNVKNIQYPIVADPLLTFKSCFKSGKWITRNGVVSLSLKPNGTLRMSMLQGSSSMRKYSWSAVVSKFKNSKNWKNTSSMKDQYYCHWYFAFYKSEFNLEPSRKSTNWANMISHLCNP